MTDSLQLPTAPAMSHRRALLVITVVALPLLLILLGTGDPVDMMELFNLLPVREAYRDGHWLMPTLNGFPRLEKPPLPVWIPAGLAALFHSESLWLLRLPSVVMALLASFATYGIGCTLFGDEGEHRGAARRQAICAALFLPAMLMFNREARLATYDIYATGFLTCGVFLLVRLAERPTRGVALALLAGVATGLSILSKGPVPVATVMLPLGLWLLLYHRRVKVFALVLLAAIVSVIMFLPWLIAIGARFPNAEFPNVYPWKVWLSEFVQFGTGNAAAVTAGTKAELTDPKWYYLQMLYWVAPFTPTFIAGLVLPFLKPHGETRRDPLDQRGRVLLWLIVVGGLLMLTVPSEKKPRYALQLFPFAALLCAAVWQEFERLPARIAVDGPAKILLAAQALFFLILPIAGFVAMGMVTITGGFFKWPVVADSLHAAGMIRATLLFSVLAIAGVLLWRNCVRRDFARAFSTLALAGALFIFTIQYLYKSLPETHTNPARLPTEAAMAAVGGAPIATIADARPWLPTLYFANRVLPFIPPAPPGHGAYLLLITALYDGKTKTYTPVPGVDQEIATLSASPAGELKSVAQWTDENRQTTLFRWSPK